jgi:hypothetical protein
MALGREIHVLIHALPEEKEQEAIAILETCLAGLKEL